MFGPACIFKGFKSLDLNFGAWKVPYAAECKLYGILTPVEDASSEKPCISTLNRVLLRNGKPYGLIALDSDVFY